jgi:hypothetical protein
MQTESSVPERNVFSRILKGELNAVASAEVAAADSYLDEALDALDMEEPTLCKWLESDADLNRLLTTNITATARLIYRLAQQGVDYNVCMGRVNNLFFRVICAAVYRGVQGDRPSALAGLRLADEGSNGNEGYA